MRNKKLRDRETKGSVLLRFAVSQCLSIFVLVHVSDREIE